MRYYDNGLNRWIKPPIVYDTIDTDSAWGGHFVHPGKLIVTGVGPSNTAADTVQVSIIPRSWPSPSVTIDPDGNNTGRPQNPTPTDTLKGIFGKFHTSPYDENWPDSLFFSGGHTVDSVIGGPNGGYRWVTSANYGFPRAYSLSEWIENPGPAYGGQTTWQWLQSQGHDPTQFRNKTITHEVGAATNSHGGMQDLAGASPVSCGDINLVLERLVFGSDGEMAFRISEARTRTYEVVLWLSGHKYVYGHQFSPNPIARWWNAPAVLDGWTDPQVVANDSILAANYQPDPTWCDISSF